MRYVPCSTTSARSQWSALLLQLVKTFINSTGAKHMRKATTIHLQAHLDAALTYLIQMTKLDPVCLLHHIRIHPPTIVRPCMTKIIITTTNAQETSNIGSGECLPHARHRRLSGSCSKTLALSMQTELKRAEIRDQQYHQQGMEESIS